jgi:hypothetical protein
MKSSDQILKTLKLCAEQPLVGMGMRCCELNDSRGYLGLGDMKVMVTEREECIE